MFCLSGCSSVGRASAFQAEGRGFESRRPLHIPKEGGSSTLLGANSLTLAPLNTPRMGMRFARSESVAQCVSWLKGIGTRDQIVKNSMSVFGYFFNMTARVAQSVERILGKDEVTSSILVAGSSC